MASRVKKAKDKRIFKRTALRVRKKNITKKNMRGGIRL